MAGTPRKLSDIKVLTFDEVDTLIDFEGGMIGYIREAGKADKSRVSDDAILEAYRRSTTVRSGTRYPDDLVRIYGDIARELGLSQGPGLAEGFRDSIRVWPAFPPSRPSGAGVFRSPLPSFPRRAL
jgi:putative hydrolase of the HAD superfamily